MLTSIGNPQMIRHFNEYLILELLVQEPGLSRAEISRRTGLSKPTVSSAVYHLLHHRLVMETGQATNQQGRKGQVLQFNPRVFHVLLLAIGADGIEIGITDLLGNIRRIGWIAWAQLEDAADAELQLQQRLQEIMAAHSSAAMPIRFVSAGIPAVVDPQTGYVQTWLPQLERYGKLLSGTELSRLLGVEVLLDNDVNLAAVAEQEYGNGAGASSFVYISLGEGVGMGIVIEGRIYRGLAGAAGEWGQAVLRLRQHHSGAGQAKHDIALYEQSTLSTLSALSTDDQRLEHYIGNAGLRELLHEALQHDVAPHTDHHTAAEWSVAQLLQAAQANHPLALHIMGRYAERLILPLAQLVALLAPERIVLGGQIGQAAELFLPLVQEALPTLVPVMPQLSASMLDERDESAIMRGAAWAGVQRSFRYIREQMLVIGGRE